MTQKPVSPSGATMFFFLSDRIMSKSQAVSENFIFTAAVLVMETKSSASARSKWSNLLTNGRRFVVTGTVGVSSRNCSTCMRTNARMVSLQNRCQSDTRAGLCGVGDFIGMGTWFQAVTNCPQWRRPSRSFRRSMVSYLSSSQLCHSNRDDSLKEDSVK